MRAPNRTSRLIETISHAGKMENFLTEAGIDGTIDATNDEMAEFIARNGLKVEEDA